MLRFIIGTASLGKLLWNIEDGVRNRSRSLHSQRARRHFKPFLSKSLQGAESLQKA